MSIPLRSPCETVVDPRLTATDCSSSARRWTLVAAILGSSMAFVDGTVVNVALPTIQRSFGASASEMQWVVESYALFLAALLLVGGALGDRFGRRKVFMAGVALFVGASFACGLASTAIHLIVARGVQGVGAALLVPGSLSLISAAFPESERGAAIGTWSAFSGIATAVGPVVGGYLVDHYSWTWAFFVNVPTGLALLAICFWKVPESRRMETRQPVDIAGACLVTVGLGGVIFVLIESSTSGWTSSPTLLAGAIGLTALAAFFYVEMRVAAPMLPLQLFRDRNFSGANLLTFLLYAAIGGGMFFVPLNLIQVQGFSATAAGAALLPFIVVMFALSRWAGSLVDTYGPRGPLTVGPAIAAAGFALFAIPSVGANYWTTFFPAACVLGLGVTVTVAPLTTTVMNAVSADLAGTASGVNNALSRGAGLLAVAVFGLLLSWSFNGDLEPRLQEAHLPGEAIKAIVGQSQKLAGLELPALPSEQAIAAHQAVGESFVGGFRLVMLVSSGLALLSSLVAAWMISGKANRKAVAE